MGHLKHLPRAGWLLLGVPQPESVAEHSFRVGIIGITLAAMEGADVGRTAALCLLHDAHETRIGDVPSVGRAYVTTAVPEADKIETLMQAIEYQAQGYDAAAWRESSLAALRTDSGRQLAQAIGSADPHGWWSAFAASYTELRASTIERARKQLGEKGRPGS
jgi:5'-deoxynucleotidase YfbR-like HD superfamily hydrolase